jgi:hypothetical protein
VKTESMNAPGARKPHARFDEGREIDVIGLGLSIRRLVPSPPGRLSDPADFHSVSQILRS